MLVLVTLVVAALSAPDVRAQRPGTSQPAPSTGQPTRGTAKPPAPGTAKPAPSAVPGTAKPTEAELAVGIATTPDYVIGPGDVLAVVFWRQTDMSAEVVVRPDGRISIPLLNDVEVNGLTPEQLRQKLTTDALKFVQDPNVTVVVKQINSRRVFITGQVAKPGPYPLTSSMNVLQLISMAGGLLEYADEEKILIMRTVNGKTTHHTFNYKDMINRKNLKQNIDLKPDDTVIVP